MSREREGESNRKKQEGTRGEMQRNDQEKREKLLSASVCM